jgi:hypothetical protein
MNKHDESAMKITISSPTSANLEEDLFGPSNLMEPFECPNCEEALDADYIYYKKINESISIKKLKHDSANLIESRILVYLQQCKFHRKKKAIVKIQSIVRRFVAVKVFQRWRILQHRVKVLEFTHIPEWALQNNGHIIVCGIDSYKNVNLFRHEKVVENIFKESFLIPGVSAQMTLVISIALKENQESYSNTYIIVCQTQLIMRDIKDFGQKKVFDLHLLDKIKVCLIFCFFVFQLFLI